MTKLSDGIDAFLRDRFAQDADPPRCVCTPRPTYLRVLLRLCRCSPALDTLQPQDISDYIAYRLEHSISPRLVARGTPDYLLLLRFLGKHGACRNVDWKGEVNSIRADAHLPRYLLDAEAKALLFAINTLLFYRDRRLHDRDLAMVLVMLDTGLRVSELLRLDVTDATSSTI